jgi:CheY-like chemotaxis protein
MADVEFLKLHLGLRPGPQVRLSVSDTGHGMDAVTLKRIFEPFFTTKAPGEGTGLGLAVVHGIVKEHGGGIFCYSRPREGTVFHVFFPAVTSDGMQAHEFGDRSELSLGHGERVLLLDDDMPTRRTTAAMLTRLGYKVQDYELPEDALKAFRANPTAFDIVVTDLAMPKKTGLEFTAEVLRHRPAMPIMLVTGFAGNLTPQSLRQIGITTLLLKPLTMETLGPAMLDTLTRIIHPSPTDRHQA